MSQPAQQPYGRPSQPTYVYGGGPGGYPPPQQGGPQQPAAGPGRYYTPGPEGQAPSNTPFFVLVG